MVSRRRLGAHAGLLGAGAIILALLLALLGWFLAHNAHEAAAQATQQDLKEQAEALAAQALQPFDAIRHKLKALAGEPQIRKLFETGDAITVASKAAEYQDRFPDALNLRFFLPGGYTLDNNSKPPLSYASLDLLKRAEQTSGPIGAEALLFGEPDQHIVMVERVHNEAGQLIGLMHLSLDVSLFQQALKGLTLGDHEYVELHQSVAGKPLVLATRGNVAYKQGDPVEASVENSRWSLAYWHGAVSGAPSPEAEAGVLPWVAAGGALLLLVAGLLLLRRSSRPAAAGDTDAGDAEGVIYAGAVRNIMDGAHPGMENLVPNLPSRARSDTPAVPSEALSGSDDITLIMNKKELAEQAQEAGAVFDLTGADVEEAEPTAEPAATPAESPAAETVDPVIFRAYDIRGVVGENLTPGAAELIGRAVGTEAGARDRKAVIVGRDGRDSSPELSEALIKGLCETGIDVIDVGMVPTPVLYFATCTLDADSGVMITGSHNGPEYNGLKIVLAGDTLSEAGIQELYRRIKEDDLDSGGSGSVATAEIIPDYIRRIAEDIPVALGNALKLVIDCGNGVPGMVAPQLFRALGHDVIEMYCEVDGAFPNHHPDPSQPENLEALIARVGEEGADLGLAFDGDGDRVGVIDAGGRIIWPDRQLMVLARDVLSRNPGAEIIYDVKCSRHLKSIIESGGGKPLMWKTGHSLIKSRMKQDNALLAGEMSGHIFFKERWYGFDDAMYAAARLVEVMLNSGKQPADFFGDIPEEISTPELRIELPEARHQAFMQELEAAANFDNAEIIRVDGLRIEFPDGWGLIRPSNTTPCLVLRFEAENAEALARIQEDFRGLLLSINPDLTLPF